MRHSPALRLPAFALLACCGATAVGAANAAEPVRIAVISGDGERAPKAGIVDLLVPALSAREGVALVEREEVGGILAEHDLSAAGLTDRACAVRAGALLNANALAFVERIGGTNSASHRLRFVEAPTGLVMDSVFFEAGDIGKSTAALLPAFDHALRWLRTPENEKRYVGLLGYTADQRGTNGVDVADALGALLTHELARSPSVLVVDREHLARLQDEKDLTGAQLRLALCAFLIEGEIRPAPGTPGTLNINTVIHPVAGGNRLPVITMTVAQRQIAGFPPILAARVLESIRAQPTVVLNTDPAVESQWFQQQANYLQRYGENDKALTAAESAHVLNPSPNCAFLLAGLVRASADRKAAVGGTALTEKEKQSVLQDLSRSFRLLLVSMADRRGQAVTMRDPDYTLLRLGALWQTLRSDDSQTRALCLEVRELATKAEKEKIDMVRRQWPTKPYGSRRPPVLGLTGSAFSYDAPGPLQFYLFYQYALIRERLARAESVDEYVASMKDLHGQWLTMPGYTSPDVEWVMLGEPRNGMYLDNLPKRFTTPEDRRKLLEWCEWICAQDSPHFKLAGRYYDMTICWSFDRERSIRKARELIALSRDLVAGHGDAAVLDSVVEACVRRLPVTESRQAYQTAFFDPPLEKLDARTFVSWCAFNLRVPVDAAARGMTAQLMGLDEEYVLRWLNAAIAKLPPQHLARYRAGHVQESINNVYETLSALRLSVLTKKKAAMPFPEISPFWSRYRVEEFEPGSYKPATQTLRLMDRQGKNLVLAWTGAGEGGAAEIRIQCLDLGGKVVRDYPSFAIPKPAGAQVQASVADAAFWRDAVYVAAPGIGLIVFAAGGVNTLGKLEGLPNLNPSALAVSGDTLVVGFQADYLGVMNLADRTWREIAYSASLLQRNPLDGCKSRFRVSDLLALSDGTVWMVTASPHALWKVVCADGSLKQMRSLGGGERLLENDGRLLVSAEGAHVVMANDVIRAGMRGAAIVSDRGSSLWIGRGGLYLHKQDLRQAFHLPLSTNQQPVQVDFMVRTSADTALLATAAGRFWKLRDLHRELPEEKAAAEAAHRRAAFARAQTNAIAAVAVAASSHAIAGTNSFPAGLAQDGDPYTCWAAATNDVAGAWLEFDFGRPVLLSSVRLVNGWFAQESDFTFYPVNHRARRIVCKTDAGEEMTEEVEDHHDPQFIPLQLKKRAKTLRLTVPEVYRSEVEQPNDPPWLNLSEVTFFGTRGP